MSQCMERKQGQNVLTMEGEYPYHTRAAFALHTYNNTLHIQMEYEEPGVKPLALRPEVRV